MGWRPEIEITETHLMNLSRQCLDRLAEFCEQGVVVAIDDFGTGYSSLAYLHTLPVQVLKIDRQFTQRLGGESRDSRIVSAILAIADALELEVVAEGIENAEQHAKLRELKCQRGQGYLMARPGYFAQSQQRDRRVGFSFNRICPVITPRRGAGNRHSGRPLAASGPTACTCSTRQVRTSSGTWNKGYDLEARCWCSG